MRRRVALVALGALLAAVAVGGCSLASVHAPNGAARPATGRAAGAGAAIELAHPGLRDAPNDRALADVGARPPVFATGEDFVLDTSGNGKAEGHYDPLGGLRRGATSWDRAPVFAIDNVKLDGVPLGNLRFSAELTMNTIVTRSIGVRVGSRSTSTVTSRIKDILRADPLWSGPTPDARVSFVFVRGKHGEIVITELWELDPIYQTVRLPDAGSGHRLRNATDPVVRAAIVTTERGVSAAIVGYRVDFRAGGATAEMVVSKGGSVYQEVHPPGTWGGLESFSTPLPRAQPESAEERLARETAIESARPVVARMDRTLADADALVSAYIVRVRCSDKAVLDVAVSPDSFSEARELPLFPWPGR